MSVRIPVLRVLVVTALSLGPAAVSAQEAVPAGLEERAERLAELRAEVSRLGDELAARRDESDHLLRALQAQQVDLEVQLGREALRVQQLQDLLEARREAAAVDADLEELVRPVVLDGIAQARATVEAGLPYRLDERLAALDEIGRGVEGGELAPTRALGRLWAFVEDERRLATENSLDRQTLDLHGREVLAEVARLGQVALFYRTPDGEVGFAAREGAGWAWVPLDDAAADPVNRLFDALNKGIRTGWYELPWAFGGSR